MPASPPSLLRALALLVALGWLASAVGCGYRLLRPEGRSDVTVAIVTLGNDSLEAGMELIVTRALRQEFLRRRAPRLIDDVDAADVVIRGRIDSLKTRGEAFDTVVLSVEYSVVLELDLQVAWRDGRRIPIDPAAMRESELYLASADVEAARKNREEALRRLADLLAVRIHDALDLELVAAS